MTSHAYPGKFISILEHQPLKPSRMSAVDAHTHPNMMVLQMRVGMSSLTSGGGLQHGDIMQLINENIHMCANVLTMLWYEFSPPRISKHSN